MKTRIAGSILCAVLGGCAPPNADYLDGVTLLSPTGCAFNVSVHGGLTRLKFNREASAASTCELRKND
jgi:hypothetical protein